MYSDQWAAYWSDNGDELQNLEILCPQMQYTHRAVNQSENFLSPDDPGVHTQTIEGIWRSKLKIHLQKMKGTDYEEISGYLDEYICRSWMTQNIDPRIQNDVFLDLILDRIRMQLDINIVHD